jgi:pimeloyl-ACP methyl ester carboxylesterase
LEAGASTITSPALIMVGARDGLRPWAEHLHARVPKSRYEVIDGAAHSAHFEKFDTYLRCVQVFLSERGL